MKPFVCTIIAALMAVLFAAAAYGSRGLEPYEDGREHTDAVYIDVATERCALRVDVQGAYGVTYFVVSSDTLLDLSGLDVRSLEVVSEENNVNGVYMFHDSILENFHCSPDPANRVWLAMYR